jgi:hypothetical protein
MITGSAPIADHVLDFLRIAGAPRCPHLKISQAISGYLKHSSCGVGVAYKTKSFTRGKQHSKK